MVFFSFICAAPEHLNEAWIMSFISRISINRAALLLSLIVCYLPNQSGIEAFSSKPRIASARPASIQMSSTVPSDDIATRKKRRTRFHYSKKSIPAIQQKQKSLARGNHPLVSLNLNLDSLAKMSGAAPRAQELLQRIEALHEEGYYQVAPDVVSYNSVLNAWARSSSEPVERAVELFQTQIGQHVRPTLVTYNTLILAFSNRGQAEDAKNILDFLLEQGGDIRPDTISFNSVLYAYAVNGDGIQAESLLKEMMQRAANGNVHVKADTISFNTVLHAYRNDPERAQNLVSHMETLYQAGNEDVEPDVYSYTSVIRAWASSKNKHAATNAKFLLDTMEELAETQDRPLVAPNTVTYSCVIKALATSRKAGSAQEAQQVLERMMERYESSGNDSVKPDVVVFSNVIDAWARDSSEHSASRALELLEQMKTSDIVEPNARTYTSVFRALAKRGECNAAELLLQELRESPRLSLSTIHYNSVLDAHAKSPYWNKADRAMDFLLKMERDSNVAPDIITYNSVLSACANTYGRGKNRALSVCVNMFKRPVVLEQATPITYFLLFKALAKLLPVSDARRWSLIQQGFKLCTKSGLLSQRVLTQVRRACTAEQFARLVPTDERTKRPVQYSKLPNEWTCNAQQTR